MVQLLYWPGSLENKLGFMWLITKVSLTPLMKINER